MLSAGAKKKHMSESRPLPRRANAPSIRPTLSLAGPIRGKGKTASRRKLASLGAQTTQTNTDQSLQPRAEDAREVERDPEVATLLVDGDAARDNFPPATGLSAVSSRLDFATPSLPIPPLELDSCEPQRTTSTIGSQAAAAASLRNEQRELELERMKLDRARIENDNLRMQLQLREPSGTALSKGRRGAGISRKVRTAHLMQ